jgi:hypothetical protein
MGIYALARDIYILIDEKFSISNDKEIDSFLDKYSNLYDINEVNLNDFPTEKLFIETYSLYKRIKENKVQITPERLNKTNLKVDNEKLEEQIVTAIKDTFIKYYEIELDNFDDIKSPKLLEIKIEMLNFKMERYVKREKYEKAAQIRDEINFYKEYLEM